MQKFPGKIEYFSRKSELFRSENSIYLTFSVRGVANTLRGQCPIVVFARKFTKFPFITVKTTIKNGFFSSKSLYLTVVLTVINGNFLNICANTTMGHCPLKVFATIRTENVRKALFSERNSSDLRENSKIFDKNPKFFIRFFPQV
jgi:hypothetical protein